MFKIFKRKKAPQTPASDALDPIAQELGLSAQELRLEFQQEMKRMRKFILKNGGSEKICLEYSKFLQNHKWYLDLGIVAEEEAPYSKMVAMLSALDLLNSWKKTPDEDKKIEDIKTIKEIMWMMSKLVYVSACLSFDREELMKLRREAGGVPGEITLEPRKSTEIENNMRNAIKEKRAQAESRWSYFRENGFDLFDAIKNA